MSLIDDIKTLDFKQPGNWPWPIKVGAFILIFAGIQLAAGFFLWKEQSDKIEQGRQEVDKQKQTFLEKKKLAVNLDSYKQQRAEIEQSFGALLKQLPNKSEMDALLIDINQAALGRGLAWDLFKPQPVENFTEFYAELPINIKVSGNYHDLGAFASDVAKMPRIVLITDVKLDPPKDGLLSMEAVAKTYRYLDEEEVAKQRKTAKDKAAAAAGKGAKK